MYLSIIEVILKPTLSHWALFVTRAILGVCFMIHGYPLISGGETSWVRLGSAMGTVGIIHAPVFWGFLAAFSEFFGGLSLVLGLFTRVSSLGLGFTMFIAVLFHISKHDAFGPISHPLELLAICILFIISGAGTLSLDYLIYKHWLQKKTQHDSSVCS